MEEKILQRLTKLKEIEKELSRSEVSQNPKLYKELTQEHAYLMELKDAWDLYSKVEREIFQNKELLLSEKDPDMIAVIKEEIDTLTLEHGKLKRKLEEILVPPDPRDNRGIILEVRAGTGGEEAALFVSDMVRMYQNYATSKRWNVEVLSTSASDLGGYKEYIMSMTGKNVFRLMQYEGGTHRVQRVPKTEASGRIHTSAVTVAVLLEPTEDEKVKIDERDLVIDTYRASGAGGQHVNVTDSAVRITHKPSGIVVTCQDERSQHKNKDKAMKLLSIRLVEEKRKKLEKEQSALRAMQVGSGDRSERIRTYNFPQNRVTDHRIDLTLYQLDHILEGHLDELTEALVAFFYEKALRE